VIWAGAIGAMREVHCWTDRPAKWWPQGVDRPQDTPAPPTTLDWDCGWHAPERPYHPDYHPFKWRGWWDFGTGALGDMGCHIFDAPFWALKLGHPTTVEATSTPVNGETAPLASLVSYTFPERDGRPEVRLTWYDGGLRPRRPDELEDGRPLGNQNGGILFIGDKGKILASDENAQDPRLIPESRMKEFQQPAKSIPRVEGSHEQDWIRACKGGPAAGSNFDYAGPLTEVVLLGNLAIRCGRKLHWDGPSMKATNAPEVEKYVQGEYRKGWTL
jgi:predicted dehydrogenase